MAHKSVDEIEDNAFEDCENLLTVDTHNGIRRIGKQAFWRCKSLRRINIKSVVEVDVLAFNQCENLESVEFGDRLVAIGDGAFDRCKSLKHIKLPSIITIEKYAFSESKLTDVELSEGLETIGKGAFLNCERLQRIAIPLKRDLFVFHDYMNQFDFCINLTKVDIVGGIHETVASLHMESWRTDMIAEINRINQVLPDTPANEKTAVIRQWMESALNKMVRYKAEHRRYVKEGITLLELAVWKTKLGEKEEHAAEGRTKKAKVDDESYRRDKRITCGADTVIKNLLPFLRLE